MERSRLFSTAVSVAVVASSLLSSCWGYAAEPAPRRHFSATSESEASEWQAQCRQTLFDLLKLSDLAADREKALDAAPFNAEIISTEQRDGYTLQEIEINSTPTRRIKAVLTIPKNAEGPVPAVVCIHGHGGNRHIVYDKSSLYRGFADKLASTGYVTISTEVGQHDVYEKGRTLMGERLWDVLRCADYLTTLEQVDDDRLGCAGLSLGGEMSMWLGAMDPRMKAVVSSGFLTSVANLKDRHCQCWDFPGFTDNFAFSDIYSLTAPRALQCQIGKLERAPGGFPPEIAAKELDDIAKAYKVFDKAELATLKLHPEGHVYDTPAGTEFINLHLQPQKTVEGN